MFVVRLLWLHKTLSLFPKHTAKSANFLRKTKCYASQKNYFCNDNLFYTVAVAAVYTISSWACRLLFVILSCPPLTVRINLKLSHQELIKKNKTHPMLNTLSLHTVFFLSALCPRLAPRFLLARLKIPKYLCHI